MTRVFTAMLAIVGGNSSPPRDAANTPSNASGETDPRILSRTKPRGRGKGEWGGGSPIAPVGRVSSGIVGGEDRAPIPHDALRSAGI